jgi:cytochrome c oxidase cbb3-type subunit 4
MDINTLGSIMTVVCFVAFVAIVFWAYSPASARSFEEAARLPFREDGDQGSDTGGSGR